MTQNGPDGAQEWTGPLGTARRIPLDAYRFAPATLDCWIIDAPALHPLWAQYMLALIDLGDVDGQAPAHLHRPGMTHEILVMALNPACGPYTTGTLRAGRLLHFLHPANVCEQFTATNDQARDLTTLCAKACTDGILTPETGDAPDRLRTAWRHSIHQTLNHDHDPHHGRAN